MEIILKKSTGNYKTIEEMLNFSQICGRHCYSEKDWEALENSPYNPGFIEGLIKKGHHSIFEHISLTFSMKGIPKILAMILNNEKQYATSEKSARYTQMKPIKEQKEKYVKWMEIFERKISEKYPETKYSGIYAKDKTGKTSVQKLSQENARYMTSVFTPTKMVHTLNLRQINYIIGYIEEFICNQGNKNEFNKRLSENMKEFLNQVEMFKIKDLTNQTNRHLSFFGKPVEEHFGDVYSINYIMSFACLAQAHRHRTINYQISKDIESGAHPVFHIPMIIRDTSLEKEWVSDLNKIGKNDFPQAQLIQISEKGTLEDFRSKLILRLCGHAQHEIMERTLHISKIYSEKYCRFSESFLKPKCIQEIKCNNPCIWGGGKALERLI